MTECKPLDTGLLDRICNNIIAIDTLKLKQFRGWGALHHTPHIHGGDLLLFRDLSLFLNRLVLEA